MFGSVFYTLIMSLWFYAALPQILGFF